MWRILALCCGAPCVRAGYLLFTRFAGEAPGMLASSPGSWSSFPCEQAAALGGIPLVGGERVAVSVTALLNELVGSPDAGNQTRAVLTAAPPALTAAVDLGLALELSDCFETSAGGGAAAQPHWFVAMGKVSEPEPQPCCAYYPPPSACCGVRRGGQRYFTFASAAACTGYRACVLGSGASTLCGVATHSALTRECQYLPELRVLGEGRRLTRFDGWVAASSEIPTDYLARDASGGPPSGTADAALAGALAAGLVVAAAVAVAARRRRMRRPARAQPAASGPITKA